jgi:hypothetical protein
MLDIFWGGYLNPVAQIDPLSKKKAGKTTPFFVLQTILRKQEMNKICIPDETDLLPKLVEGVVQEAVPACRDVNGNPHDCFSEKVFNSH